MADARPRRLFAAALSLVVVAGCAHQSNRSGFSGRHGAIASPPPVPTTKAATKTVKPQLSIAGIIAPYQNVQISSTLTEPADSVPVSEGDRVHAGETIAVLDTADLQAQYDSAIKTAQSDDAKVAQSQYTAQLTFAQAPDTVRSAREALVQAQQNVAQAKIDLARYQQLVTKGYLDEQQYRQQITTVEVDESTVRSDEASLNSAIANQQANGNSQNGLQAADIAAARADAAAQYAAAKQDLVSIQKAKIVSPVDGVIVNRNLNPGEYPNGRTLFVIQQLSSVYAELNASSSDVFSIPTGGQVALSVSGTAGNKQYTGRVVGVLGQVSPGSTNFTVKVVVQNPDGKLQSGIPVTGEIGLPPTTGVGIPTAAFLDDSHTTVMANVNGKAVQRTISEVASDGTTSIVRGLASGTTIVSNGQLGVTAGQTLTVASTGSQAPGAGESPAPNASEQPAPAASGEPNTTGASPSPAASGHHHHHAQGDQSGGSGDANSGAGSP